MVYPPMPAMMVREHHAPVGALRHHRGGRYREDRLHVREHHAPVGALRRPWQSRRARCTSVREHHAPVGALRRPWQSRRARCTSVREHHAPVGALRQLDGDTSSKALHGQGAPRTCRGALRLLLRKVDDDTPALGQGAPRTCRGALRRRLAPPGRPPGPESGSTTHL